MNAPQHAAVPDITASHTSTRGVSVRPPRIRVVKRSYRDSVGGGIGPIGVRELLDDGGYSRVSVPSLVVYRLCHGRHMQTGVVVEVSVNDYREGRIRRHEATKPEQENRIVELTETSGIEQLPVMLTHPERAGISTMLDQVTAAEPEVTVTSGDGTVHTVWVRHDPDLARIVQQEVGGLEALYIADGHHRMAAAERTARIHEYGGPHTRAFTLAALFPSNQMRVLGYHRCLPRPAHWSSDEIVELLAAQPATAGIDECPSAATAGPYPGVLAVSLDGRWFRLKLRSDARPNVRDSLDAVALDENLLPTVAASLQAEDRSATPGGKGERVVSGCRCSNGDGIRFLPHPPSVDEVMAVSDAGMLMPAKSTWFDPKACAGLFARELIG